MSNLIFANTNIKSVLYYFLRTAMNYDLIVAVLVCLLFPFIALVTATTIINQASFIDPYVYAAYIYDYHQTIERFGQTYYSSRIAYIFLEQGFAKVFGVEIGYYACRIVALSSAAGALFAIAFRYYGRGAAVLAVAWLCFIPWLPRSLLWTFYDGFSTVYLLIALALFIAPRRRRLVFSFAAGATCSLAINCNFLLFALTVAFAPSWWILNRSKGWRWLCKHALATVVGFLAAYTVLALAYRAQFSAGGGPFLEDAALGMVRSFSEWRRRELVCAIRQLRRTGNLYSSYPTRVLCCRDSLSIEEFHFYRRRTEKFYSSVYYLYWYNYCN